MGGIVSVRFTEIVSVQAANTDRDPWWIFTTVALFYKIETQYEMSLREIVRISPRFFVMLAAMILSIIFLVLDILSVTDALKSSLPLGINPFWKLSFVFKCLTDSVVLDDFKTALDRLRAYKISRLGSYSGDINDRRHRSHRDVALQWDQIGTASQHTDSLPSPDGDYIQRDRWPQFKRPKFHHKNPDKNKDREREREKGPDKEHKDSVVDPHSANGASSRSTRESVVEELPLRQMESALVSHREDDRWDDVEAAMHRQEEVEYGAALREVSAPSPPSSPIAQKFQRRPSAGP
jgi:hypothetical protein